jgi:hypothetical protein
MSPQSKADAEGEDEGGPCNVLPLGLYRRHDGANQENYWSVTFTLQVAHSLHLALTSNVARQQRMTRQKKHLSYIDRCSAACPDYRA